MPIIKKKQTAKKAKPTKTKKPLTRALKKAQPTKNTLAYYECMCHQAKQGLKGKRITAACHDCKHNALTIKTQMSAQKLKDVRKLAQSHAEFKKTLEEYVRKH